MPRAPEKTEKVKKKKSSAEAVDNGPNAEVMEKNGFGPARKTKLIGGSAFQWFDPKNITVRFDFGFEDGENGGWASVSFGPLGSAELQFNKLADFITKNKNKLASLAASTDSKAVTVKEHHSKQPKTEKITKSKPADKPDEDLEKLFDEKTNPLLRRRK
jgi:hypothetical protein